jgi:hypothetical protein
MRFYSVIWGICHVNAFRLCQLSKRCEGSGNAMLMNGCAQRYGDLRSGRVDRVLVVGVGNRGKTEDGRWKMEDGARARLGLAHAYSSFSSELAAPPDPLVLSGASFKPVSTLHRLDAVSDQFCSTFSASSQRTRGAPFLPTSHIHRPGPSNCKIQRSIAWVWRGSLCKCN